MLFILAQDMTNNGKEIVFGLTLRIDAPMIDILDHVARHYPHLHVIGRA